MKLTLRWEEGSEETLHSTFKITLPKAWLEGTVLPIKQTFVDNYNSKHPNSPLEPAKIHLVNPRGELLSDDDIVSSVLQPSDTVRVKPGAPLSLSEAIEQRKALARLHQHSKGEAEGHVTTAEALKRAQEPKFAFDYSKWDKLDLSDEDGEDCHPNIDLESWKRLRGRQRKERREAEDKKISKFNQKILKYSNKVEELEKKLKTCSSEEEAQLLVDLTEAKNSKKEYEDKLEIFLASRKLVADDVCEVKESKGLVVREDENIPASLTSTSTSANTVSKTSVIKPESKEKEYESYDSYQKANRHLLKQFAQLRNDIESEEFLLKYPQLLSDHAEGFLLLLTLDTCMKHELLNNDPTKQISPQDKKLQLLKEYLVGKAHLSIHYICELSKTLKRDFREAIKPFYRKTGPKAEDKVEGFEEDLSKFLERIRARAKEKISKGEVTPLVDNEASLVSLAGSTIYEPAGLGPGGLDPNEVLKKLPEKLQTAFVEQNTEKLKEAFGELSSEEAEFWFKQCVDSGLWLTNKNSEENNIPELTEEELKELIESLPKSVSEVFKRLEETEESEEFDENKVLQDMKEALKELEESERQSVLEKCLKTGLMSEEFIQEVQDQLPSDKKAQGEPEVVKSGTEKERKEVKMSNIMQTVIDDVEVD